MTSLNSSHNGPYEDIPTSASPGLLFLKQLMPALDSLDPDANPLSRFTTPSSTFSTGNSSTTTDPEALHEMFKHRASMLESFHHKLVNAWDVPSTSSK